MDLPGGTYLLDVVVSGATLIPEYSHLKKPIWLVIHADSLDQPFSTPEAKAWNPVWEYPFRLVLNVSDISTSYLFITLCTYADDRTIKALARSRVPLGSMPSGNAKMINFPMLMKDREVCVMRFCATISQYTPQSRMQTPMRHITEIGGKFGGMQPPMRMILTGPRI